MSYNRYDVHWVNLDAVRGREMSKTCPAVIVSLDELNRALETLVVCPLTRTVHPTWRSRLKVKIGGFPEEVAADQIRTVSKVRVGKKLGLLSAAEAERSEEHT